jgi:hypothetical protein
VTAVLQEATVLQAPAVLLATGVFSSSSGSSYFSSGSSSIDNWSAVVLQEAAISQLAAGGMHEDAYMQRSQRDV